MRPLRKTDLLAFGITGQHYLCMYKLTFHNNLENIKAAKFK